MMRCTAVLFDLDGTVTDSAEVITKCVNMSLRELGLPQQETADLRRWVGPPLAVSYQDFAGVHPSEVAHAVATYRKHYREHMFDSPIFPGITELLQDLHERGFALGTATSKREDYAASILEHLGLNRWFDIHAGAPTDRSDFTKANVIERALKRLQAAGCNISEPVIVGDRHYDIDGGRSVGIKTIGVTWSGTDIAEFELADAIVATPAQISALLHLS